MARMLMTPEAMLKLLLLTCLQLFLPQSFVQGSTDTCVPGHDTENSGGSCNFGTSLVFTLCDWKSMEADSQTWKNFYNDVNKSPCVMTDTKHLTMNQIVRLTSPLLCATNSSSHNTYSLHFLYYMYDSLRCRLSLSVYSAGGTKLAELWNTQQSTVDPRSEDWTSQAIHILNPDSPFYLIFAIERKSSSETTIVALDSIRYTTTPITTTTTTPATTPNLTVTLPPSPPTTTTPTPTTTTTTTAATTTSTTTAATTDSTTMRVTSSAVGAAPDDTLLWGLSRDVVIAIGVAIVLVIVLILVIAIICRRVRRGEEVKTVSFALASPTAYNVNEEKKSTGKRRREMKARASVLVPSKHSNWEPDRSLY